MGTTLGTKGTTLGTSGDVDVLALVWHFSTNLDQFLVTRIDMSVLDSVQISWGLTW